MDNWFSVSDKLPELLETVWVSDGIGWTTLGCRVWVEEDWYWAVSNGIIYEENGKIVSECEIDDDYDIQYWHPLPATIKK